MARWLASFVPVAFALACSAEPAPEDLTAEDLSAECVETAACLEDACSADLAAYDVARAEFSACESACPDLDDECAAGCQQLDDEEWNALYDCVILECVPLSYQQITSYEDECRGAGDPDEEAQPHCGLARGVSAFRGDEDVADFCSPAQFDWL